VTHIFTVSVDTTRHEFGTAPELPFGANRRLAARV
jgi:hypothetical protein